MISVTPFAHILANREVQDSSRLSSSEGERTIEAVYYKELLLALTKPFRWSTVEVIDVCPLVDWYCLGVPCRFRTQKSADYQQHHLATCCSPPLGFQPLSPNLFLHLQLQLLCIPVDLLSFPGYHIEDGTIFGAGMRDGRDTGLDIRMMWKVDQRRWFPFQYLCGLSFLGSVWTGLLSEGRRNFCAYELSWGLKESAYYCSISKYRQSVFHSESLELRMESLDSVVA